MTIFTRKSSTTMPAENTQQPGLQSSPAIAPVSPTRFEVQPEAAGPMSSPAFADCIRAGQGFTTRTHDALRREDHIIHVKDFNLYYAKARALYDINMSFPRGKVTALIGPSGCGKSTLLRSINRLNDLIDSVRCTGEMTLNASSVYAPSVDVIEIRKRIGMVFQKSNPFPMSVFENVIYSLRIDGESRKGVLQEACEKALRSAALWNEVKDRLKESALSMSGGQQQRLCIARAIAAEPEILLMDEPCSALDPIATLKIEEFVREIAGRITVVIVTHNMHQAARCSNYTAFMYMGRLVEYGPTAQIFQNPQLPETEQYVTGRFG